MRASKKLKNDDHLVTSLGATRLRMELDRVPLWRGEHVAIRQLVEDFARYLYLPRLKGPDVLTDAIRNGLGLLTWEQDTFAYAESHDEGNGRYRGLRAGQQVMIQDSDAPGLLVRPDTARRQIDAESAATSTAGTSSGGGATATAPGIPPEPSPAGPVTAPRPRRFHGSVRLDPMRVGRDAGRIADEVITHLAGIVGADVTVTLEIQAEIPDGATERIVRTVTENARTLKFTSQGFEEE